MKRITASDARKQWFRLLDEVAAGETVVIDRNGRRIIIQREASRVAETPRANYGPLLKVRDADRADEWSWEWRESGKPLRLKARRSS